MKQPSVRREVEQKTTLAGFVGLALWLGLFIQAAGQVRGSVMGTVQPVALGPLALGEIAKQASQDGSYSVFMKPLNGSLWYFVAWLVLGAAVGYGLTRLRAGQKK